MRPLALLLAVSLAGCYVTHRADDVGDDDELTCSGAVLFALDPYTGTCASYAPDCGNAEISPGLLNSQLASCPSQCENLGEAACLDAAGCRAGFLTVGNAAPQYWKCWSTAPGAPITITDCDGLSPYECSRRDNCVANYAVGPQGAIAFDSCGYQPGV